MYTRLDLLKVILCSFYHGIHHHSITIWDMFREELVPDIKTAMVLQLFQCAIVDKLIFCGLSFA